MVPGNKQLLSIKDDPFLAISLLMPGYSLPPHQEFMLKEMWRATYIYSSSGRSTGKTAFTGAFLLLWCATHPGTKVLLLGMKFTTPKMMMEYQETLLRKYPELAKCVELTSTGDCVLHGSDMWKMAFKNGSTIRAVPSDINKKGARVRGFRASILVIDEIAAIPSDIVRQVFMPCASITDAEGKRKVIKLTTGGYRPSLAWDDCKEHYKRAAQGDPLYAFFNFTYKDVPPEFDFIIDRDAVDNMIKNSPADEVAREIYGRWTAFGNNYFNGSMLERNRLIAVQSGARPESHAEQGGIYVIGVDPAFRGTDHTALAVLKRIAPRKWAVVDTVSINFKKGWAEENARLLLDYVERFDPVYIGLDRNGGEQLLRELTIYFRHDPDRCPIAMDAEPWEQGRRICRQFVPTSTGKDNNTRLNTRLLRALDGNGNPELLIPGDIEAEGSVETLLEFDNLQTQLLCIQSDPITTQPGLFKFSSTMRKDRYSALLYAWNAAEELVENEEDFYGAQSNAVDADAVIAGSL